MRTPAQIESSKRCLAFGRLPRPRSPEQIIQSFWEKVNRLSDNECWEWKASTRRGGYGQFTSGTQRVAHRFSWELHNGKIPSGLIVCHKCDNPKCVNPNHLFLGTYKDNMSDKTAKGRGRYAYGESSGHAKLTNEKVMAARFEYSNGALIKDIAKKYGVTKEPMRRAIRGLSWKNTPNEKTTNN